MKSKTCKNCNGIIFPYHKSKICALCRQGAKDWGQKTSKSKKEYLHALIGLYGKS